MFGPIGQEVYWEALGWMVVSWTVMAMVVAALAWIGGMIGRRLVGSLEGRSGEQLSLFPAPPGLGDAVDEPQRKAA